MSQSVFFTSLLSAFNCYDWSVYVNRPVTFRVMRPKRPMEGSCAAWPHPIPLQCVGFVQVARLNRFPEPHFTQCNRSGSRHKQMKRYQNPTCCGRTVRLKTSSEPNNCMTSFSSECGSFRGTLTHTWSNLSNRKYRLDCLYQLEIKRLVMTKLLRNMFGLNCFLLVFYLILSCLFSKRVKVCLVHLRVFRTSLNLITLRFLLRDFTNQGHVYKKTKQKEK